MSAAERTSRMQDQLRNVGCDEVRVGDVIGLDPIIGREKVLEVKTSTLHEPPFAEMKLVWLRLESRYPTDEQNYERVVVRWAEEPAIVYVPLGVDFEHANA